VVETVRVASDTVRIASRALTEGTKLWPALYASIGVLAGALVGAIANFLFNRRLEKDRADQTKRLFRWQTESERDVHTWDSLNTLQVAVVRLRFMAQALDVRLKKAGRDRTAALEAWTVARRATARYQETIERAELRLTAGFSPDELWTVQALISCAAELQAAGENFVSSRHSEDSSPLRSAPRQRKPAKT
jgi:hypothetical protein